MLWALIQSQTVHQFYSDLGGVPILPVQNSISLCSAIILAHPLLMLLIFHFSFSIESFAVPQPWAGVGPGELTPLAVKH